MLSITAPVNTMSGTDVTLTIDVEDTVTGNSNYAVVRLSVIKNVSDLLHRILSQAKGSHSCWFKREKKLSNTSENHIAMSTA